MIILLSDLHLPTGISRLREGFQRFLDGPARQASAVYLLGDLFEYWIGDDVGIEDYAVEVAALRRLSDAGIAVYFMAGNRDFLVGRRFADASGVRILKDPVVVDLNGRRTLLSHGDLLCSDDRGYQRWRRFSRNRFAQWLFNHLPRAQRLRIAGGVRGRSQAEQRNKASNIMDVKPASVVGAMQAHQVLHLIHGHTHRPADHLLHVGAQRGERIVLADWHEERMEYLVIGDDGLPQRRLL